MEQMDYIVETRKDYTLEIYVQDRRTKTKQRLHGKYEYRNSTLKWMKEEIRDLTAGLYPAPKYELKLHETWVEVTNIITGKVVMERYDTPHSCSVGSETYWSA